MEWVKCFNTPRFSCTSARRLTGGLTAGTGPGNGDRIHFGTAGTVADGGATTKGWRVLGVGSIPSVDLASGVYRSQSTTVPVNGAYIISEDQTGASTQFGASRNYFDYNNGKNPIATTSENFVTAAGNFSTAEQGSLVSQQVTGVCNLSNGCKGSMGLQTSINSYLLYPPSSGDFFTGPLNPGVPGKFGDGLPVSTTNPAYYWLRSHNDEDYDFSSRVTASSGGRSFWVVNAQFGYRPAGVFLENVTICEELCFLGKLFLFQREQVALQNLDQKRLNSLKELLVSKVGIVDAPLSISTPIQIVMFHNHYIGVTRTLNCYTVYRKCD